MVRTVVTPAKKKKVRDQFADPYGILNELKAGPNSAGYLRKPHKVNQCLHITV